MQGRGISCETPLKTGMAQESSVVEQAIVRALRDNLESIKRTADELHHAVNDVVSACASKQAYQCAAVTASRADFRSFSCRFFGGAVEIRGCIHADRPAVADRSAAQ